MARTVEPVGTDENPPVKRRRESLVPPAVPAPAAPQQAPAPPRPDTSVPTDQVAPNPFNDRAIVADSPEVIEMADSIEARGQIQASPVVTRAAFLAIFPECEAEIGVAIYVQAGGGVRLAACRSLRREIRIDVNDRHAKSRVEFLAVGTEENLKRSNPNAIEIARGVQRLVGEFDGNQSAAGRQLKKSPAWVSQQLNLLRLADEAQQLVAVNRVPVREVRGSLYQRPVVEQIATIEEIIRIRAAKEKASTDEETTGDVADATKVHRPVSRGTLVEKAIRRLGTTPIAIGQTLRGQLSRADREILAEELLRD